MNDEGIIRIDDKYIISYDNCTMVGDGIGLAMIHQNRDGIMIIDYCKALNDKAEFLKELHRIIDNVLLNGFYKQKGEAK